MASYSFSKDVTPPDIATALGLSPNQVQVESDGLTVTVTVSQQLNQSQRDSLTALVGSSREKSVQAKSL